MKRHIIFLVILAVFELDFLFSQSVEEVRKIRMEVLSIYENYVRVSSRLYDPQSSQYGDDFLKMFVGDSWIYNDVLPQNKPQELSPKDYYDYFTENIAWFSCQYSELEFSFPQEISKDEWEIQCSFKRNVSYHTKNGFVYPPHKFGYIITILVDKKIENAKIKNISVTNPVGDFFIIDNHKNNTIEYDGFRIDDWDVETQSRLFPIQEYDIQKMVCLSNDYFRPIERIQNSKDGHIYDFQNCKKDLFSIGITYVPWGFGNSVDKERFNGISQWCQTLSLSLFYGRQIGGMVQGKSTWFFNVGLDVNQHYYKYVGSDYKEYHDIDADNSSYLRRIWINDLSEKANCLSASLPLSFSYLLQLRTKQNKIVFLSFELGVFFEYAFLLKNEYALNADYHGLYDYYGGVEFDHYYDYGTFWQNGLQTLGTVKDMRCDYGVFGNVGCWLALDKSNMLKFYVGYKHGFNTPLKYKNNVVISENGQSYQSLLPSTKQGVRNLFLGVSYVRAITLKK